MEENRNGDYDTAGKRGSFYSHRQDLKNEEITSGTGPAAVRGTSKPRQMER